MKTILVLQLHCGCKLSEKSNKRRTDLKLWRSKGCDLESHFTHDTGWPQIVDAAKSEVLHSESAR